MLRLRSQVIADVTAFFSTREFIQTQPPIITSSDCEGAGEVFCVSTEKDNPKDRFFRSPKYLTVSSQLHLEALAQSVGKVWTLSPTFRAEKSDTPRHLSEFYMLEAEVSFVENLDGIMDIVEEMLRDVADHLTNSAVGKELLLARSPAWVKEDEHLNITPETLSQRWEALRRGPWPRITYAEAISRLKEAESQGQVIFDFKPSFNEGLQAEHERFIAEHIGQGGPVFVTDYPRAVKPFYMAPSTYGPEVPNASPTVACFDLLVPEICELVGGSMREHRLPELLAAMDLHGLRRPSDHDDAARGTNSHTIAEPEADVELGSSNKPSDLQWYVDLRRYGSVPHGGFGIGFDRLLGYLSGVPNIRDVVGFPRWHQRCDC
ncbi:uncharacterized protein K452DRAFT_285002 [Aplosporella prunicola CBS 121167]|uniref:Aminoacyl-transfer RNA synthetases class-II family profile domain-containing protein n=1 Tax=Aplosporella prunicola CBS 121167 TaxID=1176127 RepID=A0A6A6BKP7_9PEZI|nr:uncharacterized protein K452DRAFT_285002 [Aplosporella prunicola CBS 121167]KAF2144690.1 hypothetical protein K452DRAFT_285002 [Aplosporella prunicola CBS 121167]